MNNKEEELQNELINARHDLTSAMIRNNSLLKTLDEVRADNVRLADRNWELQKRIVEQASWPKV